MITPAILNQPCLPHATTTCITLSILLYQQALTLHPQKMCRITLIRPHKPRAFGARLAVTLKYGIGELLSGLGFNVCAARAYARSGAGPADIGFYADAALRLAAFFGGFLFA